MLLLDHHHTVVRAPWVIAVNMPLRHRGKSQQVPQPLLWRGQMRTNVIHPSLDRRRGNGNKKMRGKDQSNVPETDSARHRQIEAKRRMLWLICCAVETPWIAGVTYTR